MAVVQKEEHFFAITTTAEKSKRSVDEKIQQSVFSVLNGWNDAKDRKKPKHKCTHTSILYKDITCNFNYGY